MIYLNIISYAALVFLLYLVVKMAIREIPIRMESRTNRKKIKELKAQGYKPFKYGATTIYAKNFKDAAAEYARLRKELKK